MKKFLPFKLQLLLAGIIISMQLSAQVTIVADDFTSKLGIGDTITTFLDTTTMQINVGAPGLNNWDFSGLQVDEYFTSESKNFASSPYSSQFPGAVYASNHSGVFAGAYSDTWVYNSVTANEMVTHGTGIYAEAAGTNVTTLIKFSPAWIQYKLPIVYGNTHSYSGTQTIHTTTVVPVYGSITNTINQTYTTRQRVDGYGVFTLPGGKKHEGLRILEFTDFNYNGTLSTQMVIRILAKTGETIQITPKAITDTTGLVAIENISWTSGSGAGVIANRPEPPSELVATALTNKIDLSWTDNSDNETGFYIERSVNGGNFVRIDSTSANVTSYSDADVVPGDVYVYRVFAYNDSGVSTSTLTASAFITVTVLGPLNLTVNISQTSIGISWVDNATNESGFYIERFGSGIKSGAEEFVVIDSVGANVTSYVDENVEPGIDYTYRVRAYNEFAVSDYSNEIQAKIEITVDDPQNLSATVNAETIDLLWTDNADNEEGFYIERSDAGGDFVVIDSTSSNVSSYNDSNVSAGVVYVYRVRAYLGETNSLYSTSEAVRIIPTSTVTLKAENQGYYLNQNYPNPFTSSTKITFEIPEREHVVLTVFGLDGKVVQQLLDAEMEKGTHSVDFSVENLKSGIYYFQLKTNEFMASKKMKLLK